MKKFKWFFGVLLISVLGWYLLLKKEHYQITFETPQPPGVVYHHLLEWPIYGKADDLKIQLVEKEEYQHIAQEVRVHDSLFNYQWNIARINDSTTQVTAKIKDLQHPWTQKLQVLYTKNDFVKRSIHNVKKVGNEFLNMKKSFQVASISDTLLPSTFCTYVKVSSTVGDKATSMLKSISTVMEYVKGNGLTLNGDPFLEVTHWDRDKDLIDFNFCFPIKKSDSLPDHPELLFMDTTPMNALKAEFHGNYRISNNAWYYLMDYADRNNLNVALLPTEIYRNDPHAGGNPLEWKADILVPLKE